MKKILLTQGKYTLVDNEDFDWLNQWKWQFCNGYAVRSNSSKRKFLYMHRLINNTSLGLYTDHINRNKLDNRKSNLRNANGSLNAFNKDFHPNNTSGYKGIDFYERTGKWRVRIGNKSVGYYKFIKEAVLARKKAELLFVSCN